MVNLGHELVLSKVLPEGYTILEVVLRQKVMRSNHRIRIAGLPTGNPGDEEACQEDHR